MDTTTEHWLSLIHARGLGPVLGLRLVRYFGSPGAVVDAGASALRALGVRPGLARRIACPDRRAVDADLAWLEQPSNHFVAIDSADYPEALEHIPDPPLGLYLRGGPAALEPARIAVVGSRRPTPRAREHAYAFAGSLCGLGLAVVSGLAAGIDGAAHEGALAGGGPTLAVAGTGLDRVYPARHAALARRIEHGGLLVSEFAPGTPPRPAHFPRRNRIISGLCLGVVVVEAGRRSGSLITARLAAEQGREVFAVPGSIANSLASGCHDLIRQGATLVEHVEHIVEEISGMVTVTPGAPAAKPPASAHARGLDDEQRRLFETIDDTPLGFDHIVARVGLTPQRVSSMLMDLELRGYVEACAGSRYVRRLQRR